MKELSNKIEVSFAPSEKLIYEIEEWLIEEDKRGEGFYCNWKLITSSISDGRITVITLNNNAVGFATWYSTSDYIVCLSITEIKPACRKKGLCKQLITELFTYFRKENFYVVELQCAPASSEVVWKKLGFIDFPTVDDLKTNSMLENKKLYQVIVPHIEQSETLKGEEILELWADEPNTKIASQHATFHWNILYKKGTAELIKPIIHPSHYDWRIRWSANGEVLKDEKVKRFGKKIDFGRFLIITELPSVS